jgi:hypothetical protein
LNTALIIIVNTSIDNKSESA